MTEVTVRIPPPKIIEVTRPDENLRLHALQRGNGGHLPDDGLEISDINDLEDTLANLSIPSSGGQLSDPLVAGINLSALRAVVVNDSGQLIYADAATVSHAYRVVGIVISATTSGNTVQVLQGGKASDSSWSWLRGSPIFVGGNGLLTQTAPSSGFILPIAIVVSPTTIFVKVQDPILL